MNETSFKKAADCLQQIAAKLTKEKHNIITDIYLSYENDPDNVISLNGSVTYIGSKANSGLCGGIENGGLVPKLACTTMVLRGDNVWISVSFLFTSPQ